MGKVEVANTELRDSARCHARAQSDDDALESGESEKFLLTKRNQMRAVVISIEDFRALQCQAQAGIGTAA